MTLCSEPDKIKTWCKEEESKRYPRRQFAQKIKSAADWGQLRQLLDTQEVKQYQANPDIGQAAHQAASTIREANPKKWEEARDTFMYEWLQASKLMWTSRQVSQTVEASASTVTPEEQADIDRLNKLADWGAWKNARISLETLSSSAATTLKEKFISWKIKDVNGEKKNTWKALEKRIRELKNV